MAEIKNAFIKSRMNKDLDARLVPSGEYRDAMNISISQSEGGDVGAVENVKGNELKTLVQSLPAVANLVVIGNLMDDQSNYMYIFSTDWTGGGEAPITAKCFIHRYDASSPTNISLKLVEGSFLNFSTQNFISGVNLLEDLLFFTDNRNQPRVINVNSAASDSAYYNREENVSVAKLAPFKAINVLNSNNETVGTVDTPNNEFTVINPLSATIYQGDFVSKGVVKVGVVNSFNSGTGIVTVDSGFTLSPSDVVTFSRSGMINRTLEFLDDYNGNPAPSSSNPNYDVNWDGDPDFIKDKFIRFAYRYKFDNNEYSIISPFTATMFIPKQFGYFVGEDEERTYKSSIVAFMENYAQEMVLKIPFPSKDPVNDYKISEVDIIYKESDGLALQVLSTLQVNEISATDLAGEDNSFSFSYESKKPYKTLPEDDLIRVYDRVPIKAKAQEVIGNRVVYANYVDKNNFPNNIDYYVGAQEKDYGRYDNTAQYPYHSLKQSRTYQLGFVLSDKYGRSSSVILSTKDVNGGTLGRGSTHFHRYSGINENNPLTHPYGNALRVTVEGAIQEFKDSVYPGAYADSTGKVWTITPTSTTSSNPTTYTIDQDLTTKLFIGDSMQGKYVDYVEITNITEALGETTVTTSDQIADYYVDIPTADLAVYGYIINPLGWYSYKVVVKQTEQEYYNVYLPGIINGTFNFDAVDENQSSQVVLINDNVNKIPRDLSEVGPQQKKFRSSVRLYGRVTPAYVTNATTNNQWYPAKTSDNVSEIADAADFGYTTPQYDMYDFISNPLIAKIATITTTVGVSQISIGSLPSNATPVFQLGVYETTPVETRLELFYETGTTGLISVLNKDTNNTSDTGATGVVDYVWAFSEGDAVPFNCTGDFKFINGAGTELISGAINGVPNIINVTNKNGVDVTSGTPFSVVQGTNADVFKIQASSTLTYVNGSSNANDYTFTIQVVTNSGVTTNVLTEGNVTNVAPSFSPVDQQITRVIGDTTVIDFENPLTVSNGSSIIAEKTSGLVYNVLSQELNGVAVSNFGMSGSTLEIIDQNGVATSNNYDVQVQVSDASGLDTNYLTAVNDLNVFIGNQPLNYTSPYPTQQGNGCQASQAPSHYRTRIITFGVGNVGWDQNLPSGVFVSNGYNHSLAESGSLTSGSIRFKLGVGMVSCMANGGTAEFKVFIQFRQNSSSTWTSATDELGTAWPSGGKDIVFSGFKTSPVTQILQDFDQVGQYRIILNPDDGNNASTLCGPNGIGTCTSKSFLMSTFNYCDANDPTC